MEKLTVKKKDNIAVITINNPPVNTLNAQVIKELERAFDELRQDKQVLAVILTGAGEKAFVAGADISQFPSLDREGGIALSQKGQMVFQNIADFPCPVICAINGFALGGGLELALACDIRVVADNAKLGVPEITLGIIPGYGGTQRLSRILPMGKAKEMVFSGEMIDASSAYNIGLADRLVPAGKAMEEAMNLANIIASRGPLALQVAKKVMNNGFEMELAEALTMEAEGFGDLCETEDKNEGAQAFLEKRAPKFQGK